MTEFELVDQGADCLGEALQRFQRWLFQDGVPAWRPITARAERHWVQTVDKLGVDSDKGFVGDPDFAVETVGCGAELLDHFGQEVLVRGQAYRSYPGPPLVYPPFDGFETVFARVVDEMVFHERPLNFKAGDRLVLQNYG